VALGVCAYKEVLNKRLVLSALPIGSRSMGSLSRPPPARLFPQLLCQVPVQIGYQASRHT
jgi:hypothetical protein